MSPRRFEGLLEAVPDALVGMDQTGVIRFVNRQSELLFGYDRDELIGQPIAILLPEPLLQIYSEHRDNYFADPRTRSSGLELELSGKHKEGPEFPVNISLSHIDTGDVLLVITAVRDVNSQQRAVADAENIAAVVEYSNDAIIGSTLEGIVTSWNPAAEAMYGYSGQEIIARNTSLLVPEDRASEAEAILSEIRSGLAVQRLETARRRKDGTVFPVSLTVAPIRGEGGVIVGASAVHRDVTDQRHAFEVAQQMAAIVEGSNDAIFGRTLDGIITSWNPAAARIYGYSSHEVIGRSVAVLVPPDRLVELDDLVAKINAGQGIPRLDTIRVRKDGTMFPASLTISPIRDEAHAIVGASVIVRDMSEYVEAVNASRTMAAIVQFSAEGIIGTTLDGIITSWNPAAERIYGYAREEIIGKSGRFITPQDQVSQARMLMDKIKAGQYVEHVDTTCIRRDGTVFPVSLSVAPIRDRDGRIVGLSAIARDQTEQQ